MERPNLFYIQTISRGDKIFEKKIIKTIKVEFLQETEKYFNTIKRREYLKAAKHVRKIRHKISILGLDKSYELAGEYESDLRKNSVELKDSFNNIIISITNFINTI